MNPLDFLVNYLKTFEEGRILLSTGRYEWKVATKGKPKLVWTSEVDSGNLTVCQGNVNMFGVRLLPDGFVLYADVQSDRAELYWQVYLESNSDETFSVGLV